MTKKVPVSGLISLLVLWTTLIGGVIYVVSVFGKDDTKNSTPITSSDSSVESEISAPDEEQFNELEVSNLIEDQDLNSAENETNSNECDSNYSPCVEDVYYDLDCDDVGFQVRVVGVDTHNLDGDSDGYGCESY